MNTTNDTELVIMARNGQRVAIDKLLKRYRLKIYAQICSQISDYNEAKDLMQEVCLKVFRFIKNFNQTSSFKTWLYQITQNTIKNYYRSKKIEFSQVETPELFDDANSPEANLIGLELSESVYKVVEHFSPESQRCFYLHVITGLNYDQIASRLKCPAGTVRSRIHRMRSQIMLNAV
ncbi:RNA polymerase sigma factor [Legionella dresdenensis]|uniref:RNA polymerase sigma factor n=1 Tax=Legionella dresdenensis TaxID=450200 RepID=A0ABV8CG78_9GAMM